MGPTNPLKALIRNGFRRNKRDSSPRLIVSALKNGYRFLTLLSHAAAGGPASKEHTSLVSFLRENQARVQSVLARRDKEAEDRKASSTGQPPRDAGHVPLLVRVSDHPIVYKPGRPPRPLESFKSGVRKPPTLSSANNMIPFLRYGPSAPQSRYLERVIRQKGKRRFARVNRMLEMQEGLWEAKVEDEWENILRRQRSAEVYEKGKKKGGLEEVEFVEGFEKDVSFHATHKEACNWMIESLNGEWDDLVARGKAMWEMVLAEKELAEKEDRERRKITGEEGGPRVWGRQVWEKKKPRLRGKAEGKGKEKKVEEAREDMKVGETEGE